MSRVSTTPRGWTRRENLTATFPVVFTREVAGRTYRIAPSTVNDGQWTLDRLGDFGAWWERAHPEDRPTPAGAAALLPQG